MQLGRNRPGWQEQAEHEVLWACCAGREEPCRAVGMELFADRLECRPCSSAGSREGQPNAGEAILAAEIDDLERIKLVAPQLAWEGDSRRDAELRKVPVPLRPDALFFGAQVQGIDHQPALPAVIPGRVWTQQRISPRGRVPPPLARRGSQLDVERHRSGGAGRFERRDHLRHSAGVPTSDQIDRPPVIERLDWP